MSSSIYLTFDLEEFDIPLEYNFQIAAAQQFEMGYSGLPALEQLLNQEKCPSTFFVTGNFANQYPQKIQALSQQHEIASHCLYHTGYQRGDLKTAKEILEKIVQQEVRGLRMPRMKILPAQEILEAGYSYDSSIHPTFLPGRYNNLHYPRQPYYDNNLLRIPASVSPMLSIPLFWLSFKNFPFPLYLQLALQTLKKHGSLVLYFHPWEFANIQNFKLPSYVCKPDGERLLHQLYRLIKALKNEGAFKPMGKVLSTMSN
jgi:peptidoglycan/xylan/chitin deacetylase (PgdA/CDA1 family)